MTLRLAQPFDLPAIAALQTASWRGTYRGFLTDEFLDQTLPQEMAALWTPARLAAMWVQVAGSVEGFVSIRWDPDRVAFVDNLHVAAAARRSGHGRALMNAALTEAWRRGMDRLRLTVITGNTGAREFYQACGGQEGPPHDVMLFDHPVQVVAVTWTNPDA